MMTSKKVAVGFLCFFMLANAVVPLLGKHYVPTHDGEYHIVRFVEFSNMLRAGYPFPRWAPNLNSGYGVPIFQYHYPLPNYIGSGIRLITNDAVYAFQWSLFFAFLMVFVGFAYWLSYFFPFHIACIGSVIGSYTPYIFLDLYVRGVIGEVWAIGLFGFILGFLERKNYLLTTVFFGLLILSHNISAMIFGVYVGIYAMYRNRSVRFLFGGALLASYFWIPALFEQKYVVGLNTVNFRDHFVQLYEFLIPSWGTQFSAIGNIGNKMSFQIGIIPLIMTSIVIIRIRFEKHPNIKSLLIFLACTVSGLLLLFPFTKPIWEIVFPLQLIQYPWRLLSLSIPITAFGSAYIVHMRDSFMFVLILLLCVLGLTWTYVRPVQYEPRNESYYMSKSNFTDGTSSMGNSFSTIWTPWKNIRANTPASVTNGTVSRIDLDRYLRKRIQVKMNDTGIVQFNTLYFPGWNASVDGIDEDIQYIKNGTIQLLVPKGTHTVEIQFTETPLRRFADFLSIASLIGTVVWGILSLRSFQKTTS